MEYIKNENQGKIALAICEAIHVNASYLSEIDGATGDGDHGVNMNKGFLMAKERLSEEMSFTESMKVISRTLVEDIGGSMGPIYGTMFSKLSKATKGKDEISKEVLLEAFQLALQGLCDLAGAKVGDKTLIDTLDPAINSYKKAIESEADFKTSLDALKEGAEAGKENTKNLVAKIGRAARLGERSRGFLDAGATSCCIIIKTMAKAMQEDISER
ncbi:MAG: dihydroxyacetone kinase subunit DhaL [Longicatena sp.]